MSEDPDFCHPADAEAVRALLAEVLEKGAACDCQGLADSLTRAYCDSRVESGCPCRADEIEAVRMVACELLAARKPAPAPPPPA